MTREDINDIINAICPNDEDYEKPCISPKYLRQELEQLALDQKQWNEEPTTKNDLGVREFEEIVVEYPPEDLCTYPEYKGKPYFGIKYKENEKEIVGYGTYKSEVLSQYLKNYFISTTKDNLGVDCISRKAVQTRLKEIINEMEAIFADIREREVNDSVCGLCEYDCDHGLDGFANECPGFEKDDCFKLNEKYRAEWLDISNLPSVTPQEPKTGHWTEEFNDLEGEVRFTCSSCGKYQLFETDFCYHCGSDNREVEE